jgi:hypothetical protein
MKTSRLIIFLTLALIPGIMLGRYYWQAYPGDLFAPNHQLVVRDYLYIWAGGHLARQRLLYVVFDPNAFAGWLWSVFGTRLDLHTWSYPPPMLFLAIPFSWLPLVTGFLAWIATTSALLWIVLRAGGMSAAYAFAVVLSPAALENAVTGQNGALTAAALAGGLLLSQRRQVPAGALLGLLILKPQLGLLVPICLLARRDWRTIMWTALFASSYCAAALAAFGWVAWRDFLTVTAPFVRKYIDAPFGLATHFTMVPPFITMRAAGANLAWSYRVQAIVSILCAILAWWSWSRRSVDHRLAVALVLCLAPLATPYAHAYDVVELAVACALLARIALENGRSQSLECLLLIPPWLWPGSALIIGVLLMPGLGAFCVGTAAVFAGLYVWRTSASGSTAEQAGATSDACAAAPRASLTPTPARLP